MLLNVLQKLLLQVSVEDVKKALNEQYGGEDENSPPGTGFNTFKFTKYSNAYMLVYVRTSHWDKVRPQSPHVATQTVRVATLLEDALRGSPGASYSAVVALRLLVLRLVVVGPASGVGHHVLIVCMG